MIDDDDDASDSPQQKQCVDCKTFSPPTDASFTLVSARFGWRLTRGVDTNGDLTVEWRCPACWARLKGRPVPVAKGRA